MSKKENFKINLKKLCIFICLIIFGTCNTVYATSVQSSRPAAPYTKQASDKLTKLINEYGVPTMPIKKHITSSEFLEINIKNMINIWSMAGYDFRKSMNKYVHDMNINSIVLGLPPLYEYTMPEIFGYTTISNYYQGNQDELILKKYFSQETVNFFNKNLTQNKYKIIDHSKDKSLYDKELELMQYQTQNQIQTNSNQTNDAPDRSDVMWFYNGNGYYSPTLDTVKKVVVPSAINKFMNYAFGLINY